MFKLNRHKSEKSGERVDFKFSHFQALQVPKGWDKLFVSIISMETGKTVTKSSKASVRNGTCQWKETLSESIWLSRDNTSKDVEECLFKLVVSMGSARSGILGEAIINLATYISSRTSLSLSLPLKKCNHGTILQVKIQCLNPRTELRDEQWQETTSNLEDLNVDRDETDIKSDVSDNTYARSAGSSSSNNLGSSSHPGELGSRNPSFSASGSRHSSDSAEGSVDRMNFSPRNNINGDLHSHHNSSPYGTAPVEDLSRSNYSSFYSRFSGSGGNLQSQRQELVQNSHLLGVSSLKNGNSSKDLLEAAEDTIDELRAEAKMWERNARKLMLDMEVLKKEFTDQSRRQADLDMELSTIYAERDGLKQEIEQLKIMFEEESRVKQMAAESKNTQKGNSHIQKELEDEMKFQKESNANFAVQLKKTQESNIELVSVLQELEETVERQRLEIENLLAEKSKFYPTENNGRENEDIRNPEAEKNYKTELQLQESWELQKELQATVHLLEKTDEDKTKEIELEKNLRNQAISNIEAESKSMLSIKEEKIIKLEAKLSNLLSAQGSQVVSSDDGGDSTLIDEIEALREKVRELEADCNELTEENLELIFKLKESKKGLVTGGDSINLSNQLQTVVSPMTSEPEVQLLKTQIFQREQVVEEEMPYRVGSSSLFEKLILQNKFTDLECQFQSSKDQVCDLDFQLRASQVEIEEREMKISSLKQQLESYRTRETNKETEKLESHSSAELTKVLPELYNQLQLTLAHLKKPCYYISSHVNTECEISPDALVGLNGALALSQQEQAEAIINNFFQLNKLLETLVFQNEPVLQHVEVEERDASAAEAQKNLDDCNEKETKVDDLARELVVKMSEIEELEASLSLKEEEIEALKCSQTELKSQISDLQKEKIQVEDNLETMSRESHVTSKFLEDARKDLSLMNSSLISHVSANKMLERKLAELENGKCELELHLSELEEENVQLSQRISGLEAQLRYLTDDKESCRLELENSKSLAADLQNENKRLGMEMETQRVDLRQKLQDMQQRWSEAQEECEYLKRANPKLQATAENLIEECTSTQKLNGQLKKQKLELHERCTHLESELRECQSNFADCCKKVELLESKLSIMQNNVASKEKLITSELDAILHENKEHKEKLIMGESLLNQMYLEKTVEVENLQREVSHLMEQISATHDEREKIASNAVLEVSILRADKAKLESALQEAQATAKSTEMDLHALQLESKRKVQGLISELDTSKENQELLMAEHGKVRRLLDEVKSSEERFKSIVNGLELNLTASNYERQQLMEEAANLKVQLQKIALLQDEILTLKNSLCETRFEKDKLEASLQLLSEDCEDLKAQRDSHVEKLSSMQKAVSELEDCKRSRIALEEKILRLEGDLTAKEALCAQDAELKNELSRVRRANSQFQRKMHLLEEEKDECLKRTQALEQELKLHKEKKQNQSKSSNGSLTTFESDTEVSFSNAKLKLKDEMEENSGQDLENNRLPVKTEQFQGLPKGQQNTDADQYPREGDKKYHDEERTQVTKDDLVRKIQMLETELAEAMEANNMYKAQQKELLTDGSNDHASKRSSVSEVLSNSGYDDKVSSLETELKDIRERYFNMSLRYAEVEAQREELVMKMRTVKSGKRWFS